MHNYDLITVCLEVFNTILCMNLRRSDRGDRTEINLDRS